jgi:hypothetical protein
MDYNNLSLDLTTFEFHLISAGYTNEAVSIISHLFQGMSTFVLSFLDNVFREGSVEKE